MKKLLPFVMTIVFAGAAPAQEAQPADGAQPAEAAEPTQTAAATGADAGTGDAFDHPRIMSGENATLDEFLWLNRPLVVFADTAADPRFLQQMEYIEARLDDLAVRDVIVLTDTNPKARSALRQALRPRGFALVLIGKDGTRYLRKPSPWHVREITRVIDKLPLRQQEIRDGLGGS